MSRIGNAPVVVPKGVTYKIEGESVLVKGPLGELYSPLPLGITLEEKNGEILIKRQGDTRRHRQNHGMCRAILKNSVDGVSQGWKKTLELVGVGFRAQQKGEDLIFALGFSHEVKYNLPAGVTAKVRDQTKIDLDSIDKQKLGQVAAEIRSLKPPEPYKGKGIKYAGEVVRRKAGKAGKAGKK